MKAYLCRPRIKFDLLPRHALPKSSTASFTRNWSIDVPDEGFLEAIVARWRMQSYDVGYEDSAPEAADFNPETGQFVEQALENVPAAAPQPAVAPQPAAQAAVAQPPAAAPAPPAAPAPTPVAAAPAAAAPAPAVAGAGSSLLKKPLDVSGLSIGQPAAAQPNASVPQPEPAPAAPAAATAAASLRKDTGLGSLLQKLRN